MYKDGNKIKLDPSQLWNNAERAEKRKDGRTGRDYIINLPYQWTDEQRIEAVENFSKWLAETYKVGVQYAIHLPDEQGDQRNHHVHILTTTRELDIDKDYKVTFGRKTDLEMENAELKKQGKPVTQDQIKNIRMEWANEANRMFDKAGLALRIDHRSYKDQKLYQIPTAKLGVKASGMERKGIQTDKGDYNRLVAQANAENWKGDIVSYMDKRLDEIEHEIIVESRKQAEPIIEQSDKPTIGKPVEQSPQLTTVAPVLVEKSDKASEQTPPTASPVEPVAKPRTAQAYLDELKRQLGETVTQAPTPTTVEQLEQSPPPVVRDVIAEYTAKRDTIARKIFDNSVKALTERYNKLSQKVNELFNVKPNAIKAFFGSKDYQQWESKHDKAVNARDQALQNLDDYKQQGVGSGHYLKADEHIKKHERPFYDEYMKAYTERLRQDGYFDSKPSAVTKATATPVAVQRETMLGKAKISLQTIKNVIDTMPDNHPNKQRAIDSYNEKLQSFEKMSDEQLRQATQNMPDTVANKTPEAVIKAPTTDQDQNKGR